MQAGTGDSAPGDVVTWEATDRGANMCLFGCVPLGLFCVALGFGIWAIWGGWWKLIVVALAVAGIVGIVLFQRSPRRGRWEISFDPGAEVVRICRGRGSDETVQEIPFEKIEAIRLQAIHRDVTEGQGVEFFVPVFHLRGGEQVRLDERMSIRNPDRAEEVVEQMRELAGLPTASEGEHVP